MTTLVPDISAVTKILADQLAPLEEKSKWYCDNIYCDGKPHKGWEGKHCRSNQRPPQTDWFIWLLLSGRGFGKEIALDTPIPTPNGWTTMGDITPGQTVFDESGNQCKVTAVYNIEVPAKTYRMNFSDGTHINAGANHQWVTWTHADRKAYLRSQYDDSNVMPESWPTWRAKKQYGNNRLSQSIVEQALELHRSGMSIRGIATKLNCARNAITPHIRADLYLAPGAPRSDTDSLGPRVRTTDEIVATLTQGKRDDRNHCIPVTSALGLPETNLPLDPYVLGYWLGDGTAADGTIAVHEDDQHNVFVNFTEFQPHALNNPQLLGTYGLMTVLRKMGLYKNKHVPKEYLRASVSQRLSLLQGLMDTDGSAVVSSVEFCNTNKNLVDAVVELARSLGQKPVVAESRSKLNGKDYGPKWRVTWKPTLDVFRLERKRSIVRFDGAQQFRNFHRMIVSVEPIEPVPMRCISVNSPNHMYLCGEGMIPTHNSRCAAEWILNEAKHAPGTEWGIVAPTSDATRKCAEDLTAGIHNIAPEGLITNYNRSFGDFYLKNGAIIHLISADKPDRLRGFNLAGAWVDELASWRYPDTWHLGLLPTLRDPRTNPQIVVTSTPKPVNLLRSLIEEEKLEQGSVVVTRGSTFDNADNLSPRFLEEMKTRYEGTRRGRQELYGELLTDVDGALVTVDMIEDARLLEQPDIYFARVVVAVDPATTSGEDSDETGIIVCAKGSDNRGYVLADLSCKESPDGWARIVSKAYEAYGADRVIAEKNQGGDMVERIVRSVNPNIAYKGVVARIGKRLRAEPIAALYEQGKISHVGAPDKFEKLEDQWTTWVPGMQGQKSPDRVDALVHGLTELGLVGLPGVHFREALELDHPIHYKCGTPAPRGTKICPKCGDELYPEEDGQSDVSDPMMSVDPMQQGDPHTKAVMEAIGQYGPKQYGWQTPSWLRGLR